MNNQFKIDEPTEKVVNDILSIPEYIMKKRAEKGPSDIWFNDITVLFDVAFLLDIVPKVDMTLGEKVNAITRFAFYLAILLAVVKQNYIYFYVFIVPVIIAYIVFIFAPNKEFFNADVVEDNEINIDKNDADLTRIMEEALEEGDCQSPNQDNPLMNVMLTDNFHNRKRACNIINESVAEEVTDLITDTTNEKLYNNTTNIFNDRVSERAFYTMPNTQIPNDQGSFAKWLYQTPVSCAVADIGSLKQVRACAFNNKTMNELAADLKNSEGVNADEPEASSN